MLVPRERVDERLPASVWPVHEEFAYAIRRFDRDQHRGLIHIEDLAQVRNVYPEHKYEGNFETVASLIYRGRDTESLLEFVRRLTFSVLISNGDYHLKNWSLIYRDPQVPTLAPAYDLVSTAHYFTGQRVEDLGLKFGGSKDFHRVTLQTFRRLQQRLGVRDVDLAETAAATVERTTRRVAARRRPARPVPASCSTPSTPASACAARRSRGRSYETDPGRRGAQAEPHPVPHHDVRPGGPARPRGPGAVPERPAAGHVPRAVPADQDPVHARGRGLAADRWSGRRTQPVPYLHQVQAWQRLNSKDRDPEPTLITTGTGSGKTEAFLIPILDHCRRERQAGQTGVKAVLLYPMNALATDQANRINDLLTASDLAGVTAGLYIGERPDTTYARVLTERADIRREPPDILITNYKMLDLLLQRADDLPLWRDADIRYVVVDEFHTYDGAQGTDVAMLLRRLAAATGHAEPGRPLGRICPVATSATLGETAAAPSKIRDVAEQVFGTPFPDDSVIGEQRAGARRLPRTGRLQPAAARPQGPGRPPGPEARSVRHGAGRRAGHRERPA